MRVQRAPEQIAARLAEGGHPDDVLGFGAEVLASVLRVDQLPDPHSEIASGIDGWDDIATVQWNALGKELISYYEFALGKMLGHRGISSVRSIYKLREYAWLAGRDDVVAAVDAEPYAMYGAPKLRRFAHMMDLQWSTDDRAARMAEGRPCVDGCESGCNS